MRGTPLTTSLSRCASNGVAKVSTALAPQKSGVTVSRTTHHGVCCASASTVAKRVPHSGQRRQTPA